MPTPAELGIRPLPPNEISATIEERMRAAIAEYSAAGPLARRRMAEGTLKRVQTALFTMSPEDAAILETMIHARSFSIMEHIRSGPMDWTLIQNALLTLVSCTSGVRPNATSGLLSAVADAGMWLWDATKKTGLQELGSFGLAALGRWAFDATVSSDGLDDAALATRVSDAATGNIVHMIQGISASALSGELRQGNPLSAMLGGKVKEVIDVLRADGIAVDDSPDTLVD